MGLLSMSQVNGLNYEEFIDYFGNIIEHCPICAAAVWKNRPFQNINELHDNICKFVDQLSDIGKEGILRLHPDLAGKLADVGNLTGESAAEQKAAGLDLMTLEEKATLKEANARYREKFGFPFVICARQNKKDAILNGIVHRLNNTADRELSTGIEEVKKICLLRLQNIAESSTS